MTLHTYNKISKSLELMKAAKEKVRLRSIDIQDLKDRDMWISPDEKYRDEHGYIKYDAPQWYKNLSQAHKSNYEIHRASEKRKAKGEAPIKRKRKKKTMEMKTRKVKPKRTDEMIDLLYHKHGITVVADEPIVDYDGFTFLIGGKIRTSDNDIISVHQFIKDYL